MATLHDLGLAPGEYDVRVTPGAGQAQPYTLATAAVTDAGVDPEPNDTPELAMPLDPAALTATGRLTADTDIDQYSLTVDASLAGNLIDVTLDWPAGPYRYLCLATMTGSRIGCRQGEAGAAFTGLLLPEGDYRLEVSGIGNLDDRYDLRVASGAPLPPSGDIEPNDDAATASPIAATFAVSGDLVGSRDALAWTLSAEDASGMWRLEMSATPSIPASLELFGPDGSRLGYTPMDGAGTAAIHDLLLPQGTYTIWLTQMGAEPPRYVLRSNEETAADIDPEPNDTGPRPYPWIPTTLRRQRSHRRGPDIDQSRPRSRSGHGRLTHGGVASPGRTTCRTGSAWFAKAPPCSAATHATASNLTSLALAPGRYTLEVSGFTDLDARYELNVASGPPPAADHELEPNDLDITATTWDEALVLHGDSTDGDVDTYRVTIEGEPELWRLDVAGPGLGAPGWRQPDGTRVGARDRLGRMAPSAVIEDLYLVQGEHLLTVGAGRRVRPDPHPTGTRRTRLRSASPTTTPTMPGPSMSVIRVPGASPPLRISTSTASRCRGSSTSR